jgi:hypothetical protein
LLVRGLITVRVALPAILAAVPPVLDCVVAATFESPCDFSPPLAHLGDQLLDHFALFWRNGLVIQRRLEVLVKSLPALLG